MEDMIKARDLYRKADKLRREADWLVEQSDYDIPSVGFDSVFVQSQAGAKGTIIRISTVGGQSKTYDVRMRSGEVITVPWWDVSLHKKL